MAAKGKWAQGIQPRHFHWIIKDQLAICERPGGFGQNHRKVRRQEEIIWIREQGFDLVISVSTAPNNLHSYDELGVHWRHWPFPATEDLPRYLEQSYTELRRAQAADPAPGRALRAPHRPARRLPGLELDGAGAPQGHRAHRAHHRASDRRRRAPARGRGRPTRQPGLSSAVADPLDRIELRGLRLTGIVGVLPEERTRAQPLELDLDLELDLSAAGNGDTLSDTVDYGSVCEFSHFRSLFRRLYTKANRYWEISVAANSGKS